MTDHERQGRVMTPNARRFYGLSDAPTPHDVEIALRVDAMLEEDPRLRAEHRAELLMELERITERLSITPVESAPAARSEGEPGVARGLDRGQ